jgi:uncharacterized integral membrane protein
MSRDREQFRDDARELVEQASLWDRIKLVGGLTALGLLVLFLLQNLQEVEVHFLWFDWSIRLLFALMLSAAFGGLGAILIGTLSRRRDRRP